MWASNEAPPAVPPPVGSYSSYAELAANEVSGRDYQVRAIERPCSPVLIVAPHGGLIETGTSEIAELIAGTDYSLFLFEGLKSHGANKTLHITSHRFDHPQCLAMAARCVAVIGVHGCLGSNRIHVGGLDIDLAATLAERSTRAAFPTEAASRRYPGVHERNICNRGSSGRGAQLEFTHDLRVGKEGAAIARAVRSAIAARMAHMRRVIP